MLMQSIVLRDITEHRTPYSNNEHKCTFRQDNRVIFSILVSGLELEGE